VAIAEVGSSPLRHHDQTYGRSLAPAYLQLLPDPRATYSGETAKLRRKNLYPSGPRLRAILNLQGRNGILTRALKWGDSEPNPRMQNLHSRYLNLIFSDLIFTEGKPDDFSA